MHVDFYLLHDESLSSRHLFACKLIEKIWLLNHRIYVHCQDKKSAEAIDELLWTYKENSFVPHHIQGEGPEPPPPVQIGYSSEPRGFSDVIINLSDNIPSFISRFKRIVEIVANHPDQKENSRTLYRKYRSQNYDIKTHTIK